MSGGESVDRLRQAAAQMRALAEAADEGPWCAEWMRVGIRHLMRNCDIDCPNPAHGWGAADEGDCRSPGRYDGEYIAAMHPAVALAVADLLDRAADDHDETPCPAIDAALVVADAFIGGSGHDPLAIIEVDGFRFVRCSCGANPTPRVWLADHWTGTADDGRAAISRAFPASAVAPL